MPRDDWRLIFETERRILKRRLAQLLPWRRPEGPPGPPPDRASRGPRGGTALPRPASSSRPAPEPVPERWRVRARRREAVGTRVFHLSLSAVVHLMLLAIVLPHLLPPPLEEPAPPRSLRVGYIARDRLTDDPEEPPKEPEDEPAPAEVVETPQRVDENVSTRDPALERTAVEEVGTPEPTESTAVAGVGASPDSEGAESDLQGGGFDARSGDHAPALSRYGGNAETERAVREGLDWLARHQDRNGSWDPAGFHRHCRGGPRCNGPGFAEFRTGITALSVLAFLGAGIDGRDEHPHRRVVASGLEFLLVAQDDTGCFGRDGKEYMYNHALGTFCMTEAFLLTGDERFAEAAELGLRFSARAQQPGGGWDYTAVRTLRNDLSITGWQIMAMNSAREAGIVVDPTMHARTLRYVRRAVHPDGTATYADRLIGAGRQGISIAAVGLLAKLYMDWSPEEPSLLRAADRIIRRPPDPDQRPFWKREYQSSYYWYYATLALFHMGGERWEAWNVLLRRAVLPLQNQDPDSERRGSWPPDPNWIGAEGGRVATTALNVLTFEVYYRYQPIYRKLALDTDADASKREEPR